MARFQNLNMLKAKVNQNVDIRQTDNILPYPAIALQSSQKRPNACNIFMVIIEVNASKQYQDQL